MGLAHGNDVSLKRAIHDIPEALVDHKRGSTVIPSVLIRLRNYPCRSIRDTL